MRYLYLPFLFFFILTVELATAQRADSLKVVKGYVMDGETLSDLSGVHIYNTRGQVTISDIKGFFRIRVREDDTLTFSRIDYHRKRLAVVDIPSDNFVVSLKQKVYILDTVDIISEYSIPPYLLKPEHKPVHIDGISRYVDPERSYHMGVGGALSSPVTAIYQMFSKQYKQEKKVYELEQIQDEENEIKEKAYLRIAEVLELNDVKLYEEEYEQLVDHCNLNLHWVSTSNNYDLYLRMKDCLENFLDEGR